VRCWLVFIWLAACGGESIVVQECEPIVVLANPGPTPGGCFIVYAGESSTVRLAGDEGPGAAAVEVRSADGYEQLACQRPDVGAPALEACGESR
jgi:hypothetical protein